MQLLEFKPLYMERIWGGRNFESKLHRNLPKDKQIGESWEIVDRPDQQSVVIGGLLAGYTLRELLEQFTDKILGPGSDPQRPFPIIVKWLDCHKSLSLQVHPTAEAAAILNSEPKTEHWYILDAAKGASIISGLHPEVTREMFEQALDKGTIENYVHLQPTAPGDSITIESGCVHAINGGNLILEVQQNSNTTYRVHDWNRVDKDGTPRDLHIREALQSIHFGKPETTLVNSDLGRQVLADCREFRIRKFTPVPGEALIMFPANQQARLLHVVSGELFDQISGQTLQTGRNYLQPWVTKLELVAKTETTLLVTDQFFSQ